MYRYQSSKLKLQHPPPLRAIPRAFELLKIGFLKFPPLGGKKAIQIPHQLVLKYLSKANFVFNQTLFTLFRERPALMTPSNFF